MTTPPDMPDPAGYFTTIPVCPTCPPGSLGAHLTWTAEDWQVTTRHEDPCPHAGDAPALIHVPGCEVCHSWHHADVGISSLIPGRWAFIVQHGRTPITSRDGTYLTATGGEYCPRMEADNAVIARLAT